MVIRGKTRGNGAQLAGYLLKQADNDNVRVFEIRGTSDPLDLKASLLEMSLTAELTNSEKGLYHAQINPAYGEDKTMQPQDWIKAADILEEKLQLKDQKRVIVFHEKKGRTHAHVVWERYDHEKGIMISDSFSRLAQDQARKEMELVFQQTKTPERNADRKEMKAVLTDLWTKTVSGKDFVFQSLQKGYAIARGEFRRPFMVVDEKGRSFDLTRQLTGVKTLEVKERLKAEKLPSEKEAILMNRKPVKQLEPKPEKAIQDNQPKEQRQSKYYPDKETRKKARLENNQPQPPIATTSGYWVHAYEEQVAASLQQKQETELEREVRRLREQLEQQRALHKDRQQERSR